MHILLVNDDGIGAVGIMALLESAARRGHTVTMAAPATQQSAASHRITLTEPIFMKPYETGLPGVEAFAIKGTPADCVRIALRGGLMHQQPDVVISGINNGYNAGMDVHYSGTVGAAMEGSMEGFRAIAASIAWNAPPESLRALAELTMDMAERYCRIPALPMTVMNINAPGEMPECWRPTVYAPLNVSCYQDGYERRESPFNGSYFWLTGTADPKDYLEGTDQWYLARGHVTVTMLGNFASMSTQEWNSLGI
ncbi:MAG: 5'/3'-nucleotidase SurE [Clostridia bacterium]|nr:5'/3'-nucleotidase SurE [Clostridia bacterium]MBP3650044.1 5'/3'-nucleotidase SurE [Clostridia bacterium]